jgi:hypothetical protein
MGPGIPTAIALMLAQMVGDAGIQAKASEGTAPSGFGQKMDGLDMQSLLSGLVQQPSQRPPMQPKKFDPLRFEDLLRRT